MASITQSILGVKQVKISHESLGIEILSNLKYAQVAVDSDSISSDMPVQTEDLTEEVTYIDLAEVDLKNTRVIRPLKVRIVAYTDNLSDVEKMELALYDLEATFVISARKVMGESMVFASAVVEQGPDMSNAVKITMDFEQSGQPVKSEYAPANSADATSSGFSVNTLSSSNQTLSDLVSKVTSLI